jgi:cellulose synthase/poly-beta-1,6-N-acetylglucosamine synthase-like glycosyltransferase
VRKEGARIRTKVEELAQQLDFANVDGRVIVVVDGPQDAIALPTTIGGRRIETLFLSYHQGKAAAITAGVSLAESEIIAFADVRQTWQCDALKSLLENFKDSQVGGVSGELILQSTPGVNSGVGLYWRFEKWLRAKEAIVDSVVGVTGAICAVRRRLFDGIPAGIILDDVYWPMQIVMKGLRVQHDRRARAFDCLPNRPRDEFRRKLRTLSGNYQLMQRRPETLLPWRNRIWFQYVSHKLLRLAVPWALCGALASSALIIDARFQILFWIQILGYSALTFAALTNASRHSRLIAAGVSFAMLNLAAWLAFWSWLFGSAGKSWKAINYDDGPEASVQVTSAHL